MTESTESHEGIKQCPYCAEDIKAEAVKCKHCGEWLDERRDSPRVEPDGGSRGQTNRKAPFIPRWATLTIAFIFTALAYGFLEMIIPPGSLGFFGGFVRGFLAIGFLVFVWNATLEVAPKEIEKEHKDSQIGHDRKKEVYVGMGKESDIILLILVSIGLIIIYFSFFNQ